MKLLRYGPKGVEKPAILDDTGHMRDLSGHIPDICAADLGPDLFARLRSLDVGALPAVEGTPRIGTPVDGIGKIIGIGLNYRMHAEETGAKPRDEPLVFSKAISSLSGPNDPVVIPKNSGKTDWEVELAVIIGTCAQYVDEQNALEAIAGYTVINDVSERAFQKERGGQFIKGKSADTFAPIGPWLVTRDEVPNPQDLDLWLDVNGQRRQTGKTGDMIFPVAFLISHLSQFMTLMPGDVIATGTPAGVGMACKPPVFLKPGDVIELGVGGIGQQRQEVVAYPSAA